MKIHAYQGKALLRRFEVKVPCSAVAKTVEEAEAAAQRLSLDGQINPLVAVRASQSGEHDSAPTVFILFAQSQPSSSVRLRLIWH